MLKRIIRIFYDEMNYNQFKDGGEGSKLERYSRNYKNTAGCCTQRTIHLTAMVSGYVNTTRNNRLVQGLAMNL